MSVPAAAAKPGLGRRVLVVDDDRDFADSTSDLLALEGYEVLPAYDAGAAVEGVQRFAPAVALVDVRLGSADGIGLVTRLQSVRSDVTCVMMTAYASVDSAIASLHTGAYDYLRKPFQPDDLLATLHRAFERIDLELERSRAEDALRASERRFRDLIDGSVQGVCIHRDGVPLYANRVFAEILGYRDPAEVTALESIEPHVAPREPAARMWPGAGDDGAVSGAYEYEAVRADGTAIALQAAVRRLTWDDRPAVQMTVVDVTERKRALKALRRYEQIVSSTADLMGFVDCQAVYRAVNDAYPRALGRSREDIVGRSMQEVHGRELFEAAMKDAVERCLRGEEAHYQGWHEFAAGRRYMDVAYYPFREEEGGDAGIVISWRDLTETHTLSEKLSYQASHDPLTRLANRREFETRLRRLIETAGAQGAEHALCYLDLDQFKVINDTCGHVAGDELLRQLGTVLPEHVRKGDTLARLGGDEFGLLMEHCSITQATRVANELLDAIRDFQFHWEDKTFNLGVSIGVVPIDDAGKSITALLSTADSACYAAKDEGRNRIHVYREDDTKFARRQGEMQWVARIQRALEEDRFELYAQPIVAVAAEPLHPVHYEVLVRMQDEHGGMVLPGAFLSAAERYNLSAKLDRWVVRNVFEWLDGHPGHLEHLELCSINLSGHSLGEEDLLDLLIRHIDGGSFPAEKICIEITETAAIANLSSATRFIKILKEWGCRFALDDFGSGLSSFAYLKNLPVDYLKIDGIFIKDIVDDPIDYAMVKSINDIGHVMGKQTVAEFVDDDVILSALRNIGVDYAQGFAVGEPGPIAEVLPG